MEAKDYPEKINITDLGDVLSHYWHNERCCEEDIEYTRTDTFMEKAEKWLSNHYRDYMHNPTGKKLEAFFGMDMIKDFRNYMKGE